jgi:hypothetical protein
MNLSTTTPFLNAKTAGTAFTSKRCTKLKNGKKEKDKLLKEFSFAAERCTIFSTSFQIILQV